MTGARRWKRKTESTASRPDGQGAVLPEDGGKKSSASKGLRFYYGRWRTPDTSAVACPEAGVTLYSHSPQSGRRFIFPVNS
ncbi:hypothetical protein CV982_24715 [Salmonella enterica]|nr:hypothetical protein CV982_24715 [Salmonella enterica]RFW86120.1 hypothetical protein CV989_24895 [Salmonella enterica]RFX10498.1 hypothetical protein CV987_24770 [Salmonella enterica]